MSVKTSLDVSPCHSPLFILFSSCTDFQHIVVSPGFISEVIKGDMNVWVHRQTGNSELSGMVGFIAFCFLSFTKQSC